MPPPVAIVLMARRREMVFMIAGFEGL